MALAAGWLQAMDKLETSENLQPSAQTLSGASNKLIILTVMANPEPNNIRAGLNQRRLSD